MREELWDIVDGVKYYMGSYGHLSFDCVMCGAEAEGRVSNFGVYPKYCSKKCKQRYYRTKKKAEK